MKETPSTETVLVTGGSGYVAGWCIAMLLQRGYSVRTTLRSLSKEKAIRAAIATVADAGDRLRFLPADLTSDDGWEEAAAGCDYVLHVASPLGDDNPNDAEALIAPAREGTLRVLRAAVKAGVKRVVMTSSLAAATPSRYKEANVIDESLWSDPEDKKLNAYRKSKTLSEMAAWKFMQDGAWPTTLTTILPGAVFGPVLSGDNAGSVQVIGRLLQGRMPGTPRIGFEIVDVRDLAEAHILAMTSPKAAGQRFIAVGGFMWMNDIAKTLRSKLGKQAAKVPLRMMPDFALRLLAVFDPRLRSITPMLGRRFLHTPEKARRLLGWQTRPVEKTVVDCAVNLLG